VVGNIDGGNLTVSGGATVGNQNAGSTTVLGPGSQTPAYVSGHVTSFSMDTGTNTQYSGNPTPTTALTYTPSAGNTLIATIGYRNAGDSSNIVASITQTGVTWTRAAGWYNPGKQIAEEIWYGNITCRGTPSTTVGINFGFNTVRAAAQIAEFTGVLYGSPVDQQSGNAGTTTANTAAPFTTIPVTTTAAPELWVAGGSMKGYGSGTTSTSTCATGGLAYPALTTPSLFISLGTTAAGSSSCNYSDRINTIGYYYPAPAAGSAQLSATIASGTSGATADWTTCLATFTQNKWANTFALSGPAAANYNLTTAVGGTVSITPQPVTVTAVPSTKVYDGTTTSTGTPTYMASLLYCGDTPSTLNQTFATKDVGSGITLVPHIVVNDGNGGANYTTSGINSSGGVITPKPLNVVGSTASNKIYDGTTADPLGGAPVFGTPESPPGTPTDGLPYIGDQVSTVGPAIGSFASPNVGSGITVAFSGVGETGNQAFDYTVTQQASSTANITQRVLALGGSQLYNCGTAIPAGNLTLNNNVDAGNLTLAGNAVLAGKNVGAEAITASAFPTYATPSRVRSQVGNTATSTATTVVVTMTAPAVGNTLVAVIATRSATANSVSSISYAGSGTWNRATATAGTAGSTTEIWYAPVTSAPSGNLTINQATARAAAVVIEYTGVLTPSAVDKVANNTGSSTTPTTGTTAATTQANEVWVSGVGLVSSTYTLTLSGSPTFSPIASAQSANATSTLNAKVYAQDYIAGATGTASAGGTIGTSSQWSGAIATFKSAVVSGSLTLGGSAANNYTLLGASGSATVLQTNLFVTPSPNTKPYDGNTTAAAVPTLQANGIQACDTAPSPFWTEAYTTRNAGTGEMLVIANQTLRVSDGNGGANYNYIYGTPLTGTIQTNALTITAQTNTKMYDGTVSAAALAIRTGTIISPDIEPVWTETYNNINVGVGKTLSPTHLVINDGNSGLNYSYNYVTNFTGVITNLVIAAGGEPANLTSCDNSPAVFTVTVPGVGLTYQWQISTNDLATWSNLVGATNASYTNPSVKLTDDGNYYQVIVSASGTATITSAPPALLSVSLGLSASANPPNQTICSGVPATLAANLANGASVATWSGNGTFLPSSTALNVTYTPSAAEISAGTATVTLTGSQPGSVCAAAVSTATIAILPGPTVSAGPNQTVCADHPDTQLLGSYGGTANTFSWSGAGFFIGGRFVLNPVYVPTAGEITAGSATVTLTASATTGPCAPVTATMTITINPAATVSVATNQYLICSTASTPGLGGSFAGSATNGLWTSSGTGTFTPNTTTINAIYTPSRADNLAGTATLTLHAIGQLAPCVATTNVVVTISLAPTVSTGANQTICAGS
jgi:hypothetical protein